MTGRPMRVATGWPNRRSAERFAKSRVPDASATRMRVGRRLRQAAEAQLALRERLLRLPALAADLRLAQLALEDRAEAQQARPAGCSSARPPSWRGSPSPRRAFPRRRRTGTSRSFSLSATSASKARQAGAGDLGEHDVPRAELERVLEFLARRDAADLGREASAAQLLGEKRAAGRSIVHEQGSEWNAHFSGGVIIETSALYVSCPFPPRGAPKDRYRFRCART